MSFLLTCPACGPRDVYEFRYGGELLARPEPGAAAEAWADYLYTRANVAGNERAAWFHKDGCRRWFHATRDTRDNAVASTAWPERSASAATPPTVEDGGS